MPVSTLFGYARRFARGPSLDEQLEILLVSGIERRRIYLDEIMPGKPDSRAMFGELIRVLRSGDVLAVPFLSAFAPTRREMSDGLCGLEMRGVMFWSITDEIDMRIPDSRQLLKLAAAERRAAYIWKREQTAAACQAARGVTRKHPGRRPKLSPRDLQAAKLAWQATSGEDAAKTNAVLAAEWHLSPSRMHALFGARRPRE